MIYGIEETTDSRHPETRIVRLASEAAARRWLAAGGGFAWPGAARDDLPPSRRNFHHRLREAYEMPPRWRLQPSDYAPTDFDMWRHVGEETRKARAIRRAAVREIPPPEPPK